MTKIATDNEGNVLPVMSDTDPISWCVDFEDNTADVGPAVRLYLPEVLSTGYGEDYVGSGIVVIPITSLFDQFMLECWDESGFPSSKWFPGYLRSLADRMEALVVQKKKEEKAETEYQKQHEQVQEFKKKLAAEAKQAPGVAE